MNFDDIYEQFYKKVFNYVNSKVNNFSIAEEITSDVFLKVCEKLDTYDESKASLSTWIYTITRNKLIDYYRTRKVHEEIDEQIPDKVSVEEEVIRKDELERLAVALEKLDDRERTVIVEYYYTGKKLKDIANEIGVSYTYVKKIHQKAIVHLKELMK